MIALPILFVRCLSRYPPVIQYACCVAEFDVFLSCNTEDKAEIKVIAQRLCAEGLNPWLDEWHLVPGRAWQKGLADGVASSACTALFVGVNGVGSWQNAEAMLILNRAFTDPSYRLVPVLLPGAPAATESLFPGFVDLFTWVDLRHGADDPDAFRRLVAGIRGEAPGPAWSEPYRPRLADIDRCLTKLGVPEEDLRAATEWFAHEVSDTRSTAIAPEARWLSDAVEEFLVDLRSFAWPEPLLESGFYVSDSKIARVYRAHRHHLGDEDRPADRFRLLHRYLHGQHRLAFGPSLLLLDEPLPSGDDTWLYFSGDFRLKLDPLVFDAVPEARSIIDSADRRNVYHLVNRVFDQTDPFFLPIVEFEGSLGPHQVTMAMSRKYFDLGSYSFTALGRALFGHPVSFAGFGTLHSRQSELRPIICRIEEGR